MTKSFRRINVHNVIELFKDIIISVCDKKMFALSKNSSQWHVTHDFSMSDAHHELLLHVHNQNNIDNKNKRSRIYGGV